MTHRPTRDGGARKGRGATYAPHNRFPPSISEPVDDGWEQEAVPASLATEVREERSRSALAWNSSPDLPFDRSINPYRGCEHGCIYCFARPTHAYLDLSPRLDFTIPMPRRDNEVTEFLTTDQVQRLLQVLEEWPTEEPPRMLKLAMFTGMRRGEIFNLQDKDLNFEHKLIRLSGPKGGKTVDLPMNPIAEKILKEQLALRDEHSPGSPYVFPGRGGKRRTECSAVQRIKEKAGLPENFRIFHGLRHHFAVTLANSGEFTLDMIGELLTHKSYHMTRRYASFLPDVKKKASARASELLQSGAASAATQESDESNEG